MVCLFPAYFPVISRLLPTQFPFLFTISYSQDCVIVLCRACSRLFQLFSACFRLFPVPVCNYPTHQTVSARRTARLLAYFQVIFRLFPGYFPSFSFPVCDSPTHQAVVAWCVLRHLPLIDCLFLDSSRLYPLISIPVCTFFAHQVMTVGRTACFG